MTKGEAREKFHQFCLDDKNPDGSSKVDPDEELDWYALSVGFFIALGLDGDDSRDLAGIVRYTDHYWNQLP